MISSMKGLKTVFSKYPRFCLHLSSSVMWAIISEVLVADNGSILHQS